MTRWGMKLAKSSLGKFIGHGITRKKDAEWGLRD